MINSLPRSDLAVFNFLLEQQKKRRKNDCSKCIDLPRTATALRTFLTAVANFSLYFSSLYFCFDADFEQLVNIGTQGVQELFFVT